MQKFVQFKGKIMRFLLFSSRITQLDRFNKERGRRFPQIGVIENRSLLGMVLIEISDSEPIATIAALVDEGFEISACSAEPKYLITGSRGTNIVEFMESLKAEFPEIVVLHNYRSGPVALVEMPERVRTVLEGRRLRCERVGIKRTSAWPITSI